jgi:hypothetical protein
MAQLQTNSISNSLSGSPVASFGSLSSPELIESVIAPSLDRVLSIAGLSAYAPELAEQIREARLKALIDANRATLDRDLSGEPVRKADLVLTNPDPASLSTAVRFGFRVIGDETIGGLGMRLVTLAVPARTNVREAYKALRRAAPGLQVDFDHIYEPAGGALMPAAGVALAGSRPLRAPLRIAMIDGGVASHSSLAGASIEQRGFAGAAQPTGHGTAVGSLLVGEQGSFRGAARGAQLFVADVYGGNPAAGSVSTVVRGLAWAVSKGVSVINISLVGPNNGALARAIAAARARGIAVTAAVGNDGPAAPPQYPASYPGVISVTGVDAQGRALPEAGTAAHLDFAAPGADMIAAFPGRGWTQVRGTSFAAPLAAGRLAMVGSYERLATEVRPGKGPVGRGILCFTCRVDPKLLRAK